jgi:hypothetical protein
MTRQSHRPTFSATALSLALAAAVLIASAPARAADDDVPFDTKIIRGIMESMGLRKDGEGINYQERAPLVIPPSRTLPPPERSDAVIANNPAWPKDPDVVRAKEEAAMERDQQGFASDKINKEQSVLRGNDLTPGPKPRRAAKNNSGTYWSNDDPRLSPSQLGYKGGLFGNLFGSKEAESARFTGEPPRAALTEPPPGYQTPSPEQPYGLGNEATAPKANDYLMTHSEGSK